MRRDANPSTPAARRAMTTEAGFIQALRENPEEETRLIFADWLDDQGDPRGEFFRLQTKLAGWVPDLEHREQLHRRCRELLAAHEADWLGPLPALCEEIVWERGQPHLTLSAGTVVGDRF